MLLSFFCAKNVVAQVLSRPVNDTNYYKTYPGGITARFYLSQKYTAFTLQDKGAKDLKYWPNTTLNMGVGATYHNFSLNLAYGFGFLNQDKGKGDTRYLDLQGHFYKPKWVIDFYGQLYKGYHLEPKDFAASHPDGYYRPDASVNLFGLSAYRVFNSSRFSYRAAIIQNEWQKKSAGTFLAGAEAYYGIMNADSGWVPAILAKEYAKRDITKINYFSIGPGIGYAYTAVAFKHLFLTGSLTGNLNVSYTTETTKDNKKQNKFSLNPVTRFRVAAGCNSDSWNVSVNWIADRLPFKGSASGGDYLLQTGNYRFIIAKRLMPGPKLKKHLRLADKVFKE
ncbi:DUF4421 domain-containing protein [Ilyomonas limi]|nr:DUF4421 domain-containing protein [Ilyomonas limi]